MNQPSRPGIGAAAQHALRMPLAGEGAEHRSQQIFAVLWRGRWQLLVVVLLALLAGNLYVRTATSIYTASSVVALDSGKQNVIDIEAVATGFTGDFFDINTQVQVLTSRNLAAKVVEALKLYEVPEFNPTLRPLPVWRETTGYNDLMALLGRPRPRQVELTPEEARRVAVDVLLGKLSVSQVPRTLAFRIVVESEDPELAAAIANAIAERYIVDQLEAKFEATRLATEWLSERVGELKANLESAEAAVEEFSASTTLISEEALVLQSRQLKETRERAAEAARAADEAEVRLAAVRAAAGEGRYADAGELLGAPEVSLLAGSLETYEGDERASREARVAAMIEAQLARLDIDAERARRQAASLAESVAEQEATIAEQSRALVELRQLQREAEASRTLYEFFLARMKETAAQEGIQQADARILSPAVRPLGRSAPRGTMVMAVAMMIGFMIGSAYVLVADRLDNTFRSSKDLERFTGLASMGTIPAAPLRRRRALIDYVLKRPTSSLSEGIRNLRTSILLSNIDRPPKVIMITSSVPAEGKTTCSIGLAVTSASMGKRVLLLECDFRRRVLARYFGGGDRPGLISVLAGNAEVGEAVVHHEESGVDVIIGEKTPVSATDIFTSDRFAQFIEAMRDHYDFIFLDTPPVLAVPDARMIAKRADAMVFAVHWRRTSRAMVEDALALFQQVDVPVTGVALTQVNVRQMARYGYGGYGGYRGVAKYYTG